MKRILLNVLFYFLGAHAFSQTVISGKVTREKGEPLPGASIFLEGTYDGTSANAEGVFRFKTTKTGEYILKIEFMGYEPASQKVNLKGDTIHISAKLKEAFNQLNAVTITAGTFEASDKKQAVTITPIDMVTTAGAAGDVYGALQALPGTTINGESGHLFVKGGDSNESQTYIDGSLVYVPYNSTAPNMATRGRFNPFMFKGTVFSTGGYSAEYGQALSSVLLLNTNDMPDEDQLDLSFLSIGAEIAGTKLWKNGAVTGTFSYNDLKPYMNIAPQNYDWNRAPESKTGALSIRQKTGKTGLFKLYSSYEEHHFDLNQPDPATGEWPTSYKLGNDNYFVNASWNDKLSDKWGIHTAASFTQNNDDIHYNQTSVRNEIRGTHLKGNLSYLFTEKFILNFGGEFFDKIYSQQVRLADELHNNAFTSRIYAGFAEAQVYASQKFVTRVGLRAEYSDYLNRFRWMPRLSAAYKITDKSQFSLAWGWFYQNPDDKFLLYTNRLKPERADHYTFSYQSLIKDRTLRMELYYKNYRDLVKMNGDEFYLPSTYSNGGSGYATGLDLFWRDKKTIKNGDYWVSYSYLDTKRDYLNYPEKAVPSFTSKHNLSVVYKHWLGSLRSYPGVNFRYSSPRVYNDPNQAIFNGRRMPAYRSLDLSWSFLYRQNIIIYAAVTNATGFKNEFGQSYSGTPDANGHYPGTSILPSSDRFYVLACFITLTRGGSKNQIDNIE